MGEEPPKYQVEDVLNKKKPPPQILDLNGIIVDTADEFKTTMEKIPDYRIREEDGHETDDVVAMLGSSMRQHRLTKKHLYTQAALYAGASKELSGGVEPTEGINLSQSCHDRAHTDGVPETQVRSGAVSGPGVQPSVQETSATKEKEKEVFQATERRQRPAEDAEKQSEAATQRSTATSARTAPVGNIVVPPPPFQFSDPCPQSMRHVRIADLSSVDINWKMLTLARPTSKIDEDIFSKLVELDKMRLATRKEETKELASKGGVDPYIVLMPPSASKGGVSEKLVKVKQGEEMVLSYRPLVQVCEECREEFCSGSCIIFQLIKDNNEDEGDTPEDAAKKKKKKQPKSAKKKK